jgi:6-phosphogluconolactonase
MIEGTQHTLLVGSYASPEQPGIHLLSFDETSGALSPLGAHAGVANPSFLVVHPNGQWVYAVSETSAGKDGAPGAVWALRLAREPWGLEPISHHDSGGDWPCHLALDATGRWLLVSNYGSGTVGILPIQADGALGEMTALIRHHGHGPHPERQEGPHAHSAAFAPDQRFVIVADLGIDKLLVYAFDASAGKLGAHTHADTRPGAGPRHMAFHPNGRFLYVANELDSTLTLYGYDAGSGALRERQSLETLPPDAPENTVADIHITSAGDRLYVSNRGHNSLAAFDIAADGGLSRAAIRPCGGDWPRNFAIAPGEQFLLVANQNSGDVSVLPILTGSEALGAPVARVAVPGASCVQFLP